jgi:hypothetical protein
MTGAEQPTARAVRLGRVVAAAGRVLGLLTALPGRRDDGVAVVNGLFGDTLDDQGSLLATPMTIRAGDTELPLERTARLLGLGLDHRSAGIKDLRFGAILDEYWQEHDPGARRRTRPHQVRSLPRARYLVVGGSVTTDPEHPLARLIGDTLVTSSSAAGLVEDAEGSELFPGATVHLFPRVTHVALANRPEVYAAIDEWWPSTA